MIKKPRIKISKKLSRRSMLSHLAAATTLPLVAMPAAAAQSLSTMFFRKPLLVNNKAITLPFYVASAFSAEYNAATALADRLLQVAPDKTNNIISQVSSFDSYDSLLKKLAGIRNGSIILPLEFFNPQADFINQSSVLNLGYYAMAVLKPAQVFLLARGSIKTIEQLLQKPTARPKNNLLLSQLLDDFLGYQFAKLSRPAENKDDASAPAPQGAENAPAPQVAEKSITPQAAEKPIAPQDERQAATSPGAEKVVAPQAAEESIAPGASSSGYSLANYNNNFVGAYNNEEDLLQQFVTGKIDWFFALGFFDTPSGQRYLRKTGARVFPLAADGFGNGFRNGVGPSDDVDFMTGDIAIVKNNATFTLPLLWMIKEDNATVKIIDARARARARNWLMPRDLKPDGTLDAAVKWKDFSFTNLLYHPALVA